MVDIKNHIYEYGKISADPVVFLKSVNVWEYSDK